MDPLVSDPLTAARFLDLITALVKDRSSPSDDPTELLRATLDLCRSAVSLLEQDLESREPPAKRRRQTTPAAAAGTAGSSSMSAPAATPVSSGPSPEVIEFCECLKGESEAEGVPRASTSAMVNACERGYLSVCQHLIRSGYAMM